MSKLLTLFASLTLAACAPIAGDIGAGGTVVAGPVAPAPGWGGAELAWAAPGVQVVAGWDQPVFFADNSWWWWNNGAWMWWGPSGWMWGQPPVVLSTQVRDPWRFRGWGAPGQTRWAGAGRGWSGGPVVRDQRGASSWSSPANASRGRGGVWTGPTRSWSSGGGGGRSSFGGPTVRDHRR